MKTVENEASDGSKVKLVEIDGIQYREEDVPKEKKRQASTKKATAKNKASKPKTPAAPAETK